jgi:hypothetical protein
METLKIEILNPKAKKLLKDLAELKLININTQISLKDILDKLRSYEYETPSLDEITMEVREERKSRYGKSN